MAKYLCREDPTLSPPKCKTTRWLFTSLLASNLLMSAACSDGAERRRLLALAEFRETRINELALEIRGLRHDNEQCEPYRYNHSDPKHWHKLLFTAEEVVIYDSEDWSSYEEFERAALKFKADREKNGDYGVK